MARWFVFLGSLSGLAAVALGAFAAHALRGRLSTERLEVFHTGVEYQMVHSLAILMVGLLLRASPASTYAQWAGWSFVVGVLLFSGSLYGLVLAELPRLGAVTPFGGVAFLVGWALLARAAWQGL